MIKTFKEEYWIVGVTVTTIFETAWALRGYEQMLIDFVLEPGPGRTAPRHPLPLSPDRGQDAGGDGRGHDLDRRRRGHAALRC